MPAGNPPTTLQALQQWMLNILTTPNGQHQACHLESTIIQPPKGQCRDRLNIYAQGYLLRLQECLRADFPATQQLMGDELFDFFISAYIYTHPSHSPSLFDMGRGFADFLQQSQGEQAKHNPALKLPLEMVQLERLRSEVIRAKGLEGEQYQPCDPFALLSGDISPLRTNPSLRLITLSFPLAEYIEAVEQQQPLPSLPEAKPCHIAICRHHYRVTMHYLAPWQYALLQAGQQGQTLAASAQQASHHSGKPADEILAELMVWLPLAQQQGWLI